MNQQINPADYAHLGIEEIKAAVSDGSMPAATALAVLDARIAKRQAAGKALIPKIVEYRNTLASQLGQPTMPAPAYPKSKPASVEAASSTSVPASGTPADIADQLIASGVDIAQLIVELTKRMSFKA